MSYESASNLADRCNNAKGRYQSYYSGDVNILKNNFSSWNDDVGAEADKSLKSVSDTWYSAVTDGFGNAYNGAQTVKSAYAKLKSVKQKVERAVNQINSATAGIK